MAVKGRRKWAAAIVLAVGGIFEIVKNLEVAKPLIEWLDKSVHMSANTIIELLLFALCVYLLLSHGEKETESREPDAPLPSTHSESSSGNASSTSSGNTSTNSGNANAQGIGTVIIAPSPLLPSPSPVAVRREQPVKHNVKFINNKIRELTPFEYGNCLSYATEENRQKGTLKGFVANFRNERIAGKNVADWDYVRAQIVYRDDSGEEIESIGNAGWVGFPEDYVHFEGGHVRSAIIAVRQEEGIWVGISPKLQGNVHGIMMWDQDLISLPGEVRSADVILHGPQGLSLPTKRFQIDFASETFSEV